MGTWTSKQLDCFGHEMFRHPQSYVNWHICTSYLMIFDAYIVPGCFKSIAVLWRAHRLWSPSSERSAFNVAFTTVRRRNVKTWNSGPGHNRSKAQNSGALAPASDVYRNFPCDEILWVRGLSRRCHQLPNWTQKFSRSRDPHLANLAEAVVGASERLASPGMRLCPMLQSRRSRSRRDLMDMGLKMMIS